MVQPLATNHRPPATFFTAYRQLPSAYSSQDPRRENMVAPAPMPSDKLRREIAFEAARLMYSRQESEYYTAKMKAGRKLCRGWVKPRDLPSNAEIRDAIQSFARMHEGDQRTANLREMRVAALRVMRLLERFRPRLIGSVMTGHVRRGSDIDIHIFSDSVEAVVAVLREEGIPHDLERKQVRKHGEERVFNHLHFHDQFPFELTIYASKQAHYVFKSSVTGKAIERASIAELEQFLAVEYPSLDLDEAVAEVEERVDRFQIYEMLLVPLEQVKQSKKYHPEGDVLYHSLQVFDIAREERPYDEEFLLAALLHDVGKGIDPDDHVSAGLEALADYITPRTAWLIEHHMEAHAVADGSIGARARRRLEASEDFEELMLLEECDDAGREPAYDAPDIDEALDYLRDLSAMCG
ncbi:Multifunctional CCA protein [Symmachiella dynata]|uniref:Multifunctional CCA protein n=2 Tax=Symmachiella dynata TaxID=2527995 RepID=A0A517ZTJ1_9PLAN|nr:Multifunctional CCA protein [Symmachiella dynata]